MTHGMRSLPTSVSTRKPSTQPDSGSPMLCCRSLTKNSRNVDVLKRAALLRMALDYPRARRRGGCSGIPARMSNVDKRRIAAVRTLEARLDAEFKVIVDARRHVEAIVSPSGGH